MAHFHLTNFRVGMGRREALYEDQLLSHLLARNLNSGLYNRATHKLLAKDTKIPSDASLTKFYVC
jgi:hypothetical protein